MPQESEPAGGGVQEQRGRSPVPGRSIVRRALSVVGVFLGLALVIVFFGIQSPEYFLSRANFEIVTVQAVVVSLAAMGMTVVIISGGIDLSVGSVMALVTVTTALALNAGWGAIGAAAAGILTGAVCGFINGALITGLRIVPFIATLGTMGIARGLAKALAHEQTVSTPVSALDDLMSRNLDPGFSLPVGAWVMFGGGIAVAMILRYTVFGRRVYAIGGNEAAARLSGVPISATKIGVYTLSGLFTGLAGLLLFSRLTLGDPTVAMGKELDVIAAVVIGGGSLFGGTGSVLGSLVGAFLMAFLRNGCDIVEWPNYVQEIIVGVIIVVAVAVDQLRHRRST
jgi:ribose transport system permease protein